MLKWFRPSTDVKHVAWLLRTDPNGWVWFSDNQGTHREVDVGLWVCVQFQLYTDITPSDRLRGVAMNGRLIRTLGSIDKLCVWKAIRNRNAPESNSGKVINEVFKWAISHGHMKSD